MSRSSMILFMVSLDTWWIENSLLILNFLFIAFILWWKTNFLIIELCHSLMALNFGLVDPKFSLKIKVTHFCFNKKFIIFKQQYIILYITIFRIFWPIWFLFLSGFSFTDTDDSQHSRGREGNIFYSTLPLPPAQTFRHSFANLHVRWLPHIFNRIACIYQTATWWDLPPYRITNRLIDDGTLRFCLFTWWFDSSFFDTAIWDGKPVDSYSYRLSTLYYKRTN